MGLVKIITFLSGYKSDQMLLLGEDTKWQMMPVLQEGLAEWKEWKGRPPAFGSSSCGWGWGWGWRPPCRGKEGDKEWFPVIKLGCLVKNMKIKSLEQISLLSLPIKESEITDFFLGVSLNDAF